MNLAARIKPVGEETTVATPSSRDCLLSKPKTNTKGMTYERLEMKWGWKEPAGGLDLRGQQVVGQWELDPRGLLVIHWTEA